MKIISFFKQLYNRVFHRYLYDVEKNLSEENVKAYKEWLK